MVDQVRRRHLLEAWVKARLNPEKADFKYLNMETAKVVGPRDEYNRLMADVDAEVARRKAPAEYSAEAIAKRKEAEMLRQHEEALEENRKYDVRLRALENQCSRTRENLVIYSEMCDELNKVPKSGKMQTMYNLGLSLRQDGDKQ